MLDITVRHQPYGEAQRWQHCALGIRPCGRELRHHKDRRKTVGAENRKKLLLVLKKVAASKCLNWTTKVAVDIEQINSSEQCFKTKLVKSLVFKLSGVFHLQPTFSFLLYLDLKFQTFVGHRVYFLQ